MPRDLKNTNEIQLKSSHEFASFLSKKDFGRHLATVVGHGYMGREYVKALQTLGVPDITVCSRSEQSLAALDKNKIKSLSGGYEKLTRQAFPGELAIVATPTDDLIPATRHLISLGFRKILIEKPISFWSSDIEALDKVCNAENVDIRCAYNRVGYPSFLEARYLAQQEGGITSCRYEFTELVSRLNKSLHKYTHDEKLRWGIANSLHVFSMAHGLIGMPKSFQNIHTGAERIDWHPASSAFVGHGFSESGIIFNFHADWEGKGRWVVEFSTRKHNYQLCPMERLFIKKDYLTPWEEVKITTFAPNVKPGVVEQVAGMLDTEVRTFIPLFSLKDTVELTKFGEDVFGYSHIKGV